MSPLFRVTAVLLCAKLAQAATLPIEVLGPDGYIASVTLTVPAGQGSTVDGLWMQVNNLGYPNPVTPYAKASVQINNGPWIDLTNQSVQVADPGKSYGGIGGGFNTLKMTLPLSPGTVQDGDNIISFRFNQTDGVSSGYRVVKLNFTSGGTPVLPTSAFQNEDPSTWSAPVGGNAANGQLLWQGSKPLVFSPLNGSFMIAKCMDCHTKDGRDLKYFNFSNQSIQVRAQFHGLTAQDGLDLAAYIRTLPVYQSVNGRPWNPVYQPGPGIDSQPLQEWAAGAGIDNVLDNDAATLQDIFPSGINAQTIATTADSNVRQIRLAMQLLDWNHWLPHTHPLDAWGASIFGNAMSIYNQLRADLTSGNITQWSNDFSNLGLELTYNVLGNGRDDANNSPWSPTYSQNIYDVRLWEMVKTWEVMNEFNLQTQAVNQQMVAMQAATENVSPLPPNVIEPRGWFSSDVFNTSPNMLKLPRDSRTVNGSALLDLYLANVWYELQLVLNSHRWNYGNSPQDWGYVPGIFYDLYAGAAPAAPPSGYSEAARAALFLIKAGQIDENGNGPDHYLVGWNPSRNFNISLLISQSFYYALPTSTMQQLAQAMLQVWTNKLVSYPYAQYNTSAYANDYGNAVVPDRNELPGTYLFDNDLGADLRVTIPAFRQIGVSETLLQQLVTWAEGMWPRSAWELLRTGTSSPAISFNNGINPSPLQAGGSTTLLGNLYSDAYVNGQEADSGWPAGLSANVEFYANDVKIGDGIEDAPGASQYHFVWQNLPAGTYNVEARVNVNGKFIGSGAMAFTITGTAAPHNPPFITISNNAAGTNVLASHTDFMWTASVVPDPSGLYSISQLQWFDNGNSNGSVFATPPWINTMPYNMPLGAHIWTAQATDNTGLVGTSPPVPFNVVPAGVTPPTVNFVSPLPNQHVASGGSISLTATASGPNPISSIQFYQSSTTIGSVSRSGQSLSWSGMPDGIYYLIAIVTDNQGVTGVSAPLVVAVGSAAPPPTISITSPANNASVAPGANITITANVATPGGALQNVAFYQNGVLLNSGSFTSYVWNSVPAGIYNLTAIVTDSNQNTAASNTVFVDATGIASSGSPCDINSDGSTNVQDVQLEVNMALQLIPCTNPDSVCNVTSVQKVVNAAVGGQCVAP